MSARDTKLSLLVLLFGLVTIGMGQTIVFAVLPMLGRQLGFQELQINALVSAAALMYFLASPRWGRLSDRVGRKPVILLGLGGYVVGTLVFNGFAELGLSGALAGTALFLCLMASRMLLASIMSASQPASMAYMADATTPATRIKGISKLSAASNIGTMAGPLLAQFAVFGLLAPLYVHAAFALLTLLVVWRFLPATRAHERPPGRKLGYFDPRYRGLLFIGLLMYTMFGVVQQTLGYYFQDTLHLANADSARAHGFAMMVSSGAMLFSQLVLVQRFGWRPQTLLRTGLPLACLAFLGLSLADSYATLVLAMTAFGFGMGLAGPGYAGGATLRVDSHEQGAIAGLVAAAPGLGFVIGPLLGAWLYAASPHLPYLAASVVYLLLAGWVWRQKNA